MSVKLRSDKQNIFLVGLPSNQINGAKLPSNRQVLSVLFYNIREVKLTVSESANLVIRECTIFWEKARIPTKAFPNCVKKLVDLYSLERATKKFAHADAFERMKIEEDKVFLKKQREPGRPGCLGGVDKKLADKEERARQRRLEEEERSVRQRDLPSVPCYDKKLQRGRKNLITPKLVAALDRCQLSIRDSVYILHAVVEALGLSSDDFPINKSSIQRIRTQTRKSRAEAIKTDFQNNVPDVVTIHWDGKLLPGLNVRSSKVEHLPILASFDDKEQLLAVPKLESSSGKHQAKAVATTLFDWNLHNKVQIMCCDTTASNTGRFNGACAVLEQTLERELLLFTCRHHIYELVLKSVFETKIKQITSSPDIPIFKKFRDNWNNIDSSNIKLPLDYVKEHVAETNITSLLMFYKSELDKDFIRDDYRELVELCVVFLGGDMEKKLKLRPPGAMHQARWMARAIYSLKIYLLQSQLKMTAQDKKALQDVCLFIVTLYVKPWLKDTVATKAPNQDLCFLKMLKEYEKIDATISKASISKFSHHLWYLSEEAVILSLFDDDVCNQTKIKMIANLNRNKSSDFGKRYETSKEELTQKLFDKTLDDFVSEKSKQFFSRLQIIDSFLGEDVSSWNNNVALLETKKRISRLKVVNDTAERAVKLMQDFNGLITAEEEQKQFLLRCVQEHRNLYPDCKKVH
ncbi:unnamed protein product [Diatraea saccharalis]|uniref:Uncharacterized protein n=1 Tax=Diatraea saccharalis TaxID=40085 RepID=A0A9N9QV08_9NEOP|nr:unnamed protein product [Diatraea saccharalis]